MRKKDEKRCKKGQETTIGKIIYGFLLFMPLLAVGITCITTFWNTTINMPTEQIIETNKYETNEVNTNTDIKAGNIYSFSFKDYDSIPTNTKVLYGSKFYFNILSTGVKETLETTTNYSLYLQKTSGAGRFYLNDNISGTLITTLPSGAINTLSGYFIADTWTYTNVNLNYMNIGISDYNETIYQTTTTESTELNIFYYSVDKVTESQLFNWAENSIIYTTTNATCNALSITTPFIPLLLAYWLIISVIYFLYDIALMLVWMIHRKIHELQESL